MKLIKNALMVLILVSIIGFGAVSFGLTLKKGISDKEYLDSLKVENLKLEIELKKKQIVIKTNTFIK